MGLERDANGTDDRRLETRPLPIVCQALGSLEPALETMTQAASIPWSSPLTAQCALRDTRSRIGLPGSSMGEQPTDGLPGGRYTRAFRTVSMNSWNSGRASWGPGAASG